MLTLYEKRLQLLLQDIGEGWSLPQFIQPSWCEGHILLASTLPPAFGLVSELTGQEPTHKSPSIAGQQVFEKLL
jgi:hypothetical protein